MSLEVLLLGPMVVRQEGGAAIAFQRRAAEALLAYLATDAGRPYRRTMLAGLLWPEWSERDALHNLRRVLYRLRKDIGDAPASPPFLLISRQSLQFNVESDSRRDVAEFRRLVTAAEDHNHPRGELCAACFDRLTEAAELYRGDFLQGFSFDSAAFEEWMVTEREGLHLQVLDVLTWLTDYHQGQGAYERALHYAQRQLALEPWREQAHRQAMRALGLSGQRAKALMQYETCRRILDAELGIEPEGATKALRDQIRRGDLVPIVRQIPDAGLTPSPQPRVDMASRVSSEPPPVREPSAVEEPLEQRRLITHVIADVVGAGGSLAQMDVEAWSEMMEGALDVLGDEIRRLGGEVEQRRAEGLVAVFGVPEALEDDAARAVRAALAMREAFETYISDLGQFLPAADSTRPGLAVGVVTGEGVVSVGEGVTKPVRTQALAIGHRLQQHISPAIAWADEVTYRLARSAFTWRPLEPVHLADGARWVLFAITGERLSRGWDEGLDAFSAPLVGRHREFDRLHRAVDAVRTGLGGIVTVVGEAGIGKSRLVAEARDQETTKSPFQGRDKGHESTAGDAELEASVGSVRWVEGRWLSYMEKVAYHGWQEVLRDLLALPEACNRTACVVLEDRVAALCPDRAGAISPYLARLLALPLDAPTAAQLDSLVDAGLLQSAIFRAVTDFLTCATAQAPLVLVLEDLHWADASSLSLLKHAMLLTDRVPLLLICVFRPETAYGSWALREMAMRDYPHRHTDIYLQPLSEDESSELALSWLQSRSEDRYPSEQALRAMVNRGEGNPFFTEEILRSWAEEGGATEGESSETDLVLPETVRVVLTTRIDRLPARARQVLQLASVIGRMFRYRVLADLVEDPGSMGQSLDQTLVALQRHQLIRDQRWVTDLRSDRTWGSGYAGERAYIFKHELTLEAAYAMLPRRKRRILHRRVAEALERLYPEQVATRLAQLADHWEQAGETGRALNYLKRAGEQAAAQYANAEALRLFTRALALTPEEDDETRWELLSARERVHHWRGNREAQTRDLESLEALANHDEDLHKQADVALRRAELAAITYHTTAALEAGRRALDVAEALGDPEIEALAYLRMGQAMTAAAASSVQGLNYLKRALSVAEVAELRRLEAEALYEIGLVRTVNRQAEGRHLIRRALAFYREAGDRAGEARALGALASTYPSWGENEEATEIGLRAFAVLREIGDRREEALRLVELGYATKCLGRYGEAMAYLTAARALCREVGESAHEARALVDMGVLFDLLGDYARARSAFDEALAFSPERAGLVTRVWGLCQMGLLLVHLDESEEARACVRRAISLLEAAGEAAARGWLPANRVLAQIAEGHALLQLGDPVGAITAYHEGLAVERKAGPPGTPSEIRAGLARAYVAQNEMDEALGQVEQIVDYLERGHLQGTMEPLRPYLTCHRVLSAVGDPRAAELLAEGYRLMQAWAATIDDEGLRHAYRHNVEVNRQIAAAWQRLQASR
ncbi:MAG: BTAD domain-containing putative transcriptional regulator [Anaerolineae bacterium]